MGTGAGKLKTEQLKIENSAHRSGAVLSPLESALARELVAKGARFAAFEAGEAALVGAEDGRGIDLARCARAVKALRLRLAWAERVGVVDCAAEAESRAAAVDPALAAAVAARRKEEEAQRGEVALSAADELRRLRAVAAEVDSGARSPLGSPASLHRREVRRLAFALESGRVGLGPVAGPRLPVIGSQVQRLQVRPGSVEGRLALGLGLTAADVRRALRAVGLPVRLNRSARRAVAAAGVAAILAELGPAAAWWLAPIAARAEAQARKWVRGSAVKSAANKAEIGGAPAADDVAAYRVRLQQEAEAIFRGEALAIVGRGIAKIEGAGVRLNRSARRGLAVLAVRSGRRGGAGRESGEAWEYAAIRARDGREVGGGWALQGAVHGLRDFWLSAAGSADAEATETEELPPLDAEEHEDAERLGILRSRPDAGEGSGPRPSVLASLDAWAAGMRDAFRDRVQAATAGQAAAKAKAAAADAMALVDGLRAFSSGRSSPDSEAYLDFFDASGALSATGRKRLQRLRERGGIHVLSGPARGAEVRQWTTRTTAAGDAVLVGGAARTSSPSLPSPQAKARPGRWAYFVGKA